VLDVEGAKKLLAEAGLAKGTKLTHTVGQTANLVPAAQVLQAQLTRIGIDLQLEVMDWPAYIKRQRAMDFTSTKPTSFRRSIRTTRTTATSTPRVAPTSCPAATRTRRPTSCSRTARRRSMPASAPRRIGGSSS
jgi:ABC-type transport system substrate-binding protein